MQVLPLRLQQDFVDFHKIAGLRVSVPTDLNEKLLDPLTPSENPVQQPRIAQCQLYTLQNDLLKQYIPEILTVNCFINEFIIEKQKFLI